MDNANFMIELEKSFLRSKQLLIKKEKEYSDGKDRLGQFHRAGAADDVLATQALIGMAVKHYTSIADMVKDPYSYSLRQWNAKITDLRNYTFLLNALLRDIGVV